MKSGARAGLSGEVFQGGRDVARGPTSAPSTGSRKPARPPQPALLRCLPQPLHEGQQVEHLSPSDGSRRRISSSAAATGRRLVGHCAWRCAGSSTRRPASIVVAPRLVDSAFRLRPPSALARMARAVLPHEGRPAFAPASLLTTGRRFGGRRRAGPRLRRRSRPGSSHART